MRFLRVLLVLLMFAFFGGWLMPLPAAHAIPLQPVPPRQVSAYELIVAMNTLRVSYGNPPLIEDPIVNAVAQYTAQVMAEKQMSWHIGNVRGRLAAAGYGGGATVWATENFAVGLSMTIDQIMAAWADPDHMRPAVEAAYCHVGAGVATASNGRTYYVLQAAYISGQSCGSYTPGSGNTPAPGGSSSGGIPQYIVPVQRATPDADGNVYHIVQSGQTFWAIAIAYQVTIADLERWNNLSRDVPLRTGQKLYIPGPNAAGYPTPTPKGLVTTSTPDAEGRIVHEVQPYQTLITIAQAYGVTVERILSLNGLQPDWPLRIGQQLVIDPGRVTPSPTLSAIQRLTPEADGRYYHTVQSGQTLSWIANYYDIPLSSLLAWNGLTADSIIRPGQKLLLRVTPPATATATPAPPSVTPTFSPTPSAGPSFTPMPPPSSQNRSVSAWPFLVVGLLILSLGGLAWFGPWRRR
ncbi:MAG: LysM peptidoglycan-binding domain-containing protein [Anaerolineales bacterium]|nr:LysM peptidoglycan-binding domain-containing protein [Anaerolineales bacterium]MDW8278133.1 LysM peptidoglycan-binding domain-containing protein [Anaerolineales bacterium]